MITCPRCDSENASIVTTSPVRGAWEVYLCHICLFCWRSTEPETIINAQKYKQAFKVDPKKIPNATEVPAIPSQLTNGPTFPPLRVRKSKDFTNSNEEK